MPLLMVPPTINKFYIADLAPGRSIVEHYVAGGQQVFMMSWRNPDERHAEWGLDTYGQAVLDAMDAVERATGSEQVSLQAFCSGGIITSMVLAHLAATGRQDRVASVSFAVTVLDWARAGTVSALMDEESVKAATETSRKKGYLDGAQLAEVFAWLRPNDLIWNYWVNNYLQGKPPPNFDILYWNADTTRMTAGLHRDFIDIALGNALTEPGAATMLGTPVDLSTVTVDSYVTAGIADHLCPWQSCYRTTQLLGGRQPLRPVHQRAHRLAGEPAGQPEVDVPGRGRRRRRTRRSGWRRPRRSRGRGGRTSWRGWASGPARRSRPRRRSAGELEELARGARHVCLRQVAPHAGREYVRTVTAGGRTLRVVGPPGDGPVRPAAAADERHRRQPGGAAALRRRAATRAAR